MLEVYESFHEYGNEKTVVLEEATINKAVDSAIAAIKEELPEEAQTVEVMEFILEEMGKSIKASRVLL